MRLLKINAYESFQNISRALEFEIILKLLPLLGSSTDLRVFNQYTFRQLNCLLFVLDAFLWCTKMHF